MMSSYCQNLPLCENRALDVQALMMTCNASSKRACASSYGHAEAGELGVAIALADAELQTAAGHQIEGRCPLGEQHRVVPGQDDDRCTKPHRCRARGHPCKQVERGRHLPEVAEVVLDQEARLEPQRLGLDACVDVIPEASRRIAVPTPRLGAAEQAEPHTSASRRCLTPDCDRSRIMDRVKRGR